MAPSVYANMDATEQRLTLQWLKDGMKPTKVRRASVASHAHVPGLSGALPMPVGQGRGRGLGQGQSQGQGGVDAKTPSATRAP